MNNWFKRNKYFYVSCVYKNKKFQIACLTYFVTSKNYQDIEKFKEIAKIILAERYNIIELDDLYILAVTKVTKKEYDKSLDDSQFTQLNIE